MAALFCAAVQLLPAPGHGPHIEVERAGGAVEGALPGAVGFQPGELFLRGGLAGAVEARRKPPSDARTAGGEQVVVKLLAAVGTHDRKRDNLF